MSKWHCKTYPNMDAITYAIKHLLTAFKKAIVTLLISIQNKDENSNKLIHESIKMFSTTILILKWYCC